MITQLIMDGGMAASGLGKSPLFYKGSALYQIHLVKTDAIRPFIPKELKLDDTLGYTLGGFYLANYHDSSFGPFDELVVIAGTVKRGSSPSCAWNAKVLINNDQVRKHAQKELGIVSEAANFSKKMEQRRARKTRGFLNINGLGNYKDINITEIKDKSSCSITITTPDFNGLMISPQIKLSLPCLSGLTEHHNIPRQFLEYSCEIQTRVRVTGATKVHNRSRSCSEVDEASNMRDVMAKIVLESKPLAAFEFSSMEMVVATPTLVLQRQTSFSS